MVMRNVDFAHYCSDSWHRLCETAGGDINFARIHMCKGDEREVISHLRHAAGGDPEMTPLFPPFVPCDFDFGIVPVDFNVVHCVGRSRVFTAEALCSCQ